MTKYKVGQKVRIEWRDGSAVEGTVGGGFDQSSIAVGPDPYPTFYRLDFADDGRKVTILSEPRPPEPTRLGTVVEASVEDGVGERRPWVLIPKTSSTQRGQEWHDGIGVCVWDQLVDPVVNP